MNTAFTICSNNYLAKARVAAETFLSKHEGYDFHIFLVDKKSKELTYEEFKKFYLTEIQDIVEDIDALAIKYNIIELNTAVKPAVFLFLLNQLKYDSVIYLDPDTMIFNRFIEVETAFQEGENIVITPHFCSPIDDGKYPSEIDFNFFGIYNLGFIAVRNSIETIKFLEWWDNRLMKYGYFRPEKGMFTDQLWVNYVPIFFKGVRILKDLGYNAANWNLYERSLTEENGNYIINNNTKLKFFHFSHYSFENPYQIAKHQTRHTIEERPDLISLIDKYQAELTKNNFKAFSDIPCYYNVRYLEHQRKLWKKRDLSWGNLQIKANQKLKRIVTQLIS